MFGEKQARRGLQKNLLLIILALILTRPQGWSQDYSKSPWTQAENAVRIGSEDLAIQPDRWDTRWRLESTDELLRAPMDVPRASRELFDVLRSSPSSADLIRLAANRLGYALPLPASPPRSSRRGWPASRTAVRPPLPNLRDALRRAQVLLDRSVASLTADERERVLNAWSGVIENSENSADLEAAMEASTRFDLVSLLQAAGILAETADGMIPTLSSSTFKSRPDMWVITGDSVTVDASVLDRYPLILNFSRQTHYLAPPARATTGQIRLVIDFSDDVVIESTTTAGAGYGQFGIGLFYLANPHARIMMQTQDLSQGAGVFGVGGLFLKGACAQLDAARGAQGVGAFGVGVLSSQHTTASTYTVRLSGQGVGFTHGVGLFLHEGNEAQITGGLFYPDPREDLAFISLSQGMGYGPRAFAAGGVGLALVKGDRNHVRASYFAQGAGYWHGFGGFFVDGNDNTLMARRYSQGTGVHTALGSMILRGDRNTTINWGVGPAYGWDYGVGVFDANGDDNLFRADWATGHGEVNGHGLGLIQGVRNRIALPAFGTGTLNRMSPSYGLAVVRGGGSIVVFPATSGTPETHQQMLPLSPWGVLDLGPGVSTVEKLSLPPIDWPKPSGRETARAKERVTAQQRMAESEQKPPADRWKEWLSIASEFSLDAAVPGRAQDKLTGAGRQDVEALLALVSSDRFDEFIRLRTVLGGLIWNSEDVLAKAFSAAQGTRRVQLLSLTAYGSPMESSGMVKTALDSPDWRLRRTAIWILGLWFSRDQTTPLGRIPFFTSLRDLLKGTPGSIPEKERNRFFDHTMHERYLGDLLAILSMDPELPAEARQAVTRTQADWLSPVSRECFQAFLSVLFKNPVIYQKMLNEEIQSADAERAAWRSLVEAGLKDPSIEVRESALLALGQWGDTTEVEQLAPFLNDGSGALREAAATALGRMGPAGTPAITAVFHSTSPAQRSLAMVAASQSADPAALLLLSEGLRDPDEQVRRTTLSTLNTIPPEFKKELRPLRKILKRLKKKDSSSDIWTLAEYFRKYF